MIVFQPCSVSVYVAKNLIFKCRKGERKNDTEFAKLHSDFCIIGV